MDATYEDFEKALQPVLADLERQRPWLKLRIERAAHGESSIAIALEPSGSGSGLHLSDAYGRAEAVAHLADQVQELVTEALAFAGRGSTWPPCPEHPGTHPLVVAVVEGEPAWICPSSDRVVGGIGTLRPLGT